MVKLDVSLIRYMTSDEIRVLTSVEMGMKNHELVPKSLINSISSLKSGGISKILLKLTQNKLLSYERGKRFDGYRLTYKGYDFLALNVLSNRNVISGIGNQIGVGKESDVYVGSDSNGKAFAVKLHRLGRTCFRTVSTKRDYQKSGHKTNWIYLSRLAAKREMAFMQLLFDSRLPIPQPIDCNRHCLVMELIDGNLLNHLSKDDIEKDSDIETLYEKLMNLIISLANDFGVIHGDFNEFNILVKTHSLEPVLIDFPQMISISHSSAQTYFDRDVKCIIDFFAKRFGFESDFIPCFDVIDKESGLKIDAINGDIELQSRDTDNEYQSDVEINQKEIISEPNIPLITENNEKHLIETIGNIKLTEDLDQNEDNSDDSSFKGGLSSIATTFTSEQIKEKLQKERKRNVFKSRIKSSKKNIKGDNCASARRRKDDLDTLRDDIKAYNCERDLY